MSITLQDLRNANIIRSEEWCGVEEANLDFGPEMSFRAMELGGECGEALNIVKKMVRFANSWAGGVDPAVSRQALAEELADVIICVDRLASPLSIDLAKAIKQKFNKTSDKYNLKTKL